MSQQVSTVDELQQCKLLDVGLLAFQYALPWVAAYILHCACVRSDAVLCLGLRIIDMRLRVLVHRVRASCL